MRAFGLIGYPLEHSFSPHYFHEKFLRENITDTAYSLFPKKNLEGFREWLTEHPEICGLNVTIPYKEAILMFLDELDPVVKNIFAANVIAIHRAEKNLVLKGYNTDVTGFERSLQPLLKSHHQKALVFGSGGSSKAVLYVLDKLRIAATVVSRKKTAQNINYHEVTDEALASHHLLINTTPVGMHPRENVSLPIYYNAITPEHLLYDLIYNPQESLFLQQGKTRGATVKNGLEMLQIQAEESWKIWNAMPPLAGQ